MTHIADAVSSLCPNISFRVGSSYDSIEFIDPPESFAPPSREEVEAKKAELEAAEPMRLLRIERNRRIAETDWRMHSDYPGSNQEKWKTYRQALRDLPATADPQLDEQDILTNVTWPEEPE